MEPWCRKLVNEVSDELCISRGLADELLTLAGYDKEIVIKCSNQSSGLNECKAKILDSRFNKIESDSEGSND